MKKILILFSLIGCLSFAEEFKCKGDKEKDVLYLQTKSESTIKKTYVLVSNDDEDNTLKKEILEEKKYQVKIIDHLLKEHLNDLSITDVETLVKIKKSLQSQCETINSL